MRRFRVQLVGHKPMSHARPYLRLEKLTNLTTGRRLGHDHQPLVAGARKLEIARLRPEARRRHWPGAIKIIIGYLCPSPKRFLLAHPFC